MISVYPSRKVGDGDALNGGKSLIRVLLADKTLKGLPLILRRCAHAVQFLLEIGLEDLIIMLVRLNRKKTPSGVIEKVLIHPGLKIPPFCHPFLQPSEPSHACHPGLRVLSPHPAAGSLHACEDSERDSVSGNLLLLELKALYCGLHNVLRQAVSDIRTDLIHEKGLYLVLLALSGMAEAHREGQNRAFHISSAQRMEVLAQVRFYYCVVKRRSGIAQKHVHQNRCSKDLQWVITRGCEP